MKMFFTRMMKHLYCKSLKVDKDRKAKIGANNAYVYTYSILYKPNYSLWLHVI